ncbi:MAG: methylated-DNA-[protein]-cysteine S-methyltransferase [Bacteroidia bacterium]|jgi:methylated-DNA-[protein]-cysteine S-methyltransferase
MNTHYLDSPIGLLRLVSQDGHLNAIEFEHQHEGTLASNSTEDSVLAKAAQQLNLYFAGTRLNFDLPLAQQGTDFQQSVWQALGDIPYGEVRSYSDIARTIKRVKAVRAVGAANGRNRLPIVVPCHRVIGSDGSLTGFAGGLAAKQFLLELEGYRPNAKAR